MKVIKKAKLRHPKDLDNGKGYFTISLRKFKDGYYEVWGGRGPFKTDQPTKSRVKAEREFNKTVKFYTKKMGFRPVKKRKRRR